jgi:hypothetical protein
MYESGGHNDTRAKVLCDEEGPFRHAGAGVSSREDGKPCAQEGSDEDDKDGRDADANATVKVVLGGTGGHCWLRRSKSHRTGKVSQLYGAE